jgi:hypothetical protein
MEYQPFNKFLVRTPLLPFNPKEKFVIQNKDFRKAIYIASRDLYFEMLRYEKGEIKKEKERENIEKTLMKYWLRMQTRTTPFGMFSGISIGDISDNNDLVYSDKLPSTRLDMSALCLIINHLEKEEAVSAGILYYPNDSIYFIGDKVRYIEYTFRNRSFDYQISTVDKSDYLEKIIKESAKGCSKVELHKMLIDFDETLEGEEITDFLNELIESKILLNELTPCLTEPDNLSRILDIFRVKEIHSISIGYLSEINSIIHQINMHNEFEDVIILYENVIKLLKLLGIEFDYNKIFQVDTKTIFLNSKISDSLVNSVVEAINFCVKIASPVSKSDMLDNFKVKFTERYESQMISLLKAMDSDIGIGYPAYEGKYSNGLINPLMLPVKNNSAGTKRWNKNFDKVILDKVVESIKNGDEEVRLSNDDFGIIETKEAYNTFGCLFEVLNDEGLILINSVGDNSGAKLMSRFSYLDDTITELIKQVTEKDHADKDSIDAELIYLPSPRHGNIIGRPKGVRDYEVTCLSRSENDESLHLPISDLLIGVINNKIVIKSERLQKKLNIFHTNAFNYSLTDLPLFKFLGDLQYQQNFFSSISFSNIGLDHTPRIKYKNVILSLASWNINAKILRDKINGIDIEEAIKFIRNKFNLPEKVVYCQSDNELYIDFRDIDCCKIFLDVLRKNEIINLKEFLFDGNCSLISDSHKNNYRNQFNIALFKTKKK